MDFQDFIIEFAQDYGVVLLPLGMMTMVYIIRQLTAKKSSEQFGLGQGSASSGSDEKTPVIKRQAANRAMNSNESQQVQSDTQGNDQAGSTTNSENVNLYDDDDDEFEHEDDDMEHGYGMDEDEESETDEDQQYEHHELDEEEAYGDILDDEAFNEQKAQSSSASEQQQDSQQNDHQASNKNSAVTEEIGSYIVMYLVPNQNKDFLGYELLQALANYNVHLSEKKHFQRFKNDNGSGELWYHVASMTNPGTFDMSEPGKLSCQGLVFIMEVDRISQLGSAYENMLETCNALANDLDGQLLDDQQQPFQENQARGIKYFIAKSQLLEPASAE